MILKVSGFREGKKLLVLDLDHTLGDLCTGNFKFATHVRPHLHQFLTRAYRYYDMAIWSAVDMESIGIKMKQLDIIGSRTFNFLCCLDENEMVTVERTKQYKTKSLDVIWRKYPIYNKTNTIICDDQKNNYLNNFPNGINIKPYNYPDYLVDDELLKLAIYIEHLAKNSKDFSKEKNFLWHNFKF